MNANLSRKAETRTALPTALRGVFREAPRYLVASAVALAVDAGLYIGLIRLAHVHYLAAAPTGYALGIVVIYLLSTRWVFSSRRLTSVRSEFLIFTLIGIAGLLLNQAVIYVCVETFSTSFELAKLASAAIVFGFNFGGRKLILFTRFSHAE
jgi:putative flippase GtrA